MPGGPPADAGDFVGSFPAPPQPLSSCASSWSASDVATWVSEVLHLPQYAEVFESQQIDGPTLLELPEELLDSELHITNPIHRKKIIAHVKLLGAYIDTSSPPRSPPTRGRRGLDRGPAPRSASSTPNLNWSSGDRGTGLRGRVWDDQSGGSEEDFLSSGGAASLQRSSNGGTGGNLGISSASGSYLTRKENSLNSSNFIPGSALAERAAARRGRSMDKLAMLRQTQAQRRSNVTSPANSARPSEVGRSPRPSSIGSSPSQRSLNQSQISQRTPRGRTTRDGKMMSMRGKRIDAWGELSPSCSRKGSFGKLTSVSSESLGPATRDCGPLQSPLAARKDQPDPVTSYYYKASFVKSNVTAVISHGQRKALNQLSQDQIVIKSCSPGPAYRPTVDPLWTKLRVGGSIGGARRFSYDRPNCSHWLNESRED